MDYAFFFVRWRPGGQLITALVAKDKKTRWHMAYVVPSKGTETDWVAKQISKDLRGIGYNDKVILKSDQEPAIVVLKEQIAAQRRGVDTVLEESPVGDSQSNGLAERAVRNIEEMTRTYLNDLQNRIGEQIDLGHKIIDWLVVYAAQMMNRCNAGRDGHTPYSLVHGRAYKGELYQFASLIQFRISGKVQGGIMQPRWLQGIWLGKSNHSEEHIVSDTVSGAVYRCRAVQPQAAQSSLELINTIG